MNPFSSQPQEQVRAWGETRLIAKIRLWLGDACPPSPFGIGDDCAVLPPERGRGLITVDPVIYGRHFDDDVRPEDVGAKLLRRNVSDIAAMGGTPTSAVLSLQLPPDVSIKWIRGFYRGLRRAAALEGVLIVGGDVAQSGTLSASLTLLGRAPGRVLTRQGVRQGDLLFVSGRLGGSRLGHHFRFRPRVAEGRWLAGRRAVVAMMDVSDGLAKDLSSLTPPGLTGWVNTAAVPVSAAAHRLARHSGLTPLQHALGDGEDYELVFAVRGEAAGRRLELAWRKRFPETRLTRLGLWSSEAPETSGWIDPRTFQGYEHLRTA